MTAPTLVTFEFGEEEPTRRMRRPLSQPAPDDGSRRPQAMASARLQAARSGQGREVGLGQGQAPVLEAPTSPWGQEPEQAVQRVWGEDSHRDTCTCSSCQEHVR